MERTPVHSSNIRAIGYDEKEEVLEIEFNKGGVYQYTGVPKEIHKMLMDAGSKGKFFHRHIRPKQHMFKYKRVS
ncbi:MAG: KTSC domain-containing protein [Candidatus Korarchaeota archaeon]|nr:KTSC domain-containing protein [Candidatus Korarchaeota archaeon]